MKFFATAAMLTLLVSCNNSSYKIDGPTDGKSNSKPDTASVLYCPNDLATLLNESTTFTGAVLPRGFDARSIEFKNADISFMDLSGVKNLTVTQLNKTRALRGVRLPAGFVMTGFDASNKDLGDTDFSSVLGLTAKMLNDSIGYAGAILPAGMDLTDLDPTGRSINRLDFSQTVGLDPMKVLASSDALGIVYPATFFDDVTIASPTDTQTNRINEITAAITDPTSLGILEPQNIENFKTESFWVSYSSVQILDADNDPDPFDGNDHYIPAALSDVDISSVDTTLVTSVVDLDLTLIQGVDYTLFNNVAYVDDVPVPSSVEIDKIDPIFKATGWDFSNIQSKYYSCK